MVFAFTQLSLYLIVFSVLYCYCYYYRSQLKISMGHHVKKFRNHCCRHTWYELEEAMEAKSVHQLKEKLHLYRYGDRTTSVAQALTQLGKYTHT